MVLIAVVLLLAAGTPAQARTAAARPSVSAQTEGTPAQSSWWHRFFQKLLRARYAMAAN